jgi:hypothetical protein
VAEACRAPTDFPGPLRVCGVGNSFGATSLVMAAAMGLVNFDRLLLCVKARGGHVVQFLYLAPHPAPATVPCPHGDACVDT